MSSSLLLSGHMQSIESFMSESMEALSTRPENMEDVAAAGGTYSQILARKHDVRQIHWYMKLLLGTCGALLDPLEDNC